MKEMAANASKFGVLSVVFDSAVAFEVHVQDTGLAQEIFYEEGRIASEASRLLLNSLLWNHHDVCILVLEGDVEDVVIWRRHAR